MYIEFFPEYIAIFLNQSRVMYTLLMASQSSSQDNHIYLHSCFVSILVSLEWFCVLI